MLMHHTPAILQRKHRLIEYSPEGRGFFCPSLLAKKAKLEGTTSGSNTDHLLSRAVLVIQDMHRDHKAVFDRAKQILSTGSATLSPSSSNSSRSSSLSSQVTRVDQATSPLHLENDDDVVDLESTPPPPLSTSQIQRPSCRTLFPQDPKRPPQDQENTSWKQTPPTSAPKEPIPSSTSLSVLASSSSTLLNTAVPLFPPPPPPPPPPCAPEEDPYPSSMMLLASSTSLLKNAPPARFSLLSNNERTPHSLSQAGGLTSLVEPCMPPTQKQTVDTDINTREERTPSLLKGHGSSPSSLASSYSSSMNTALLYPASMTNSSNKKIRAPSLPQAAARRKSTSASTPLSAAALWSPGAINCTTRTSFPLSSESVGSASSLSLRRDSPLKQSLSVSVNKPHRGAGRTNDDTQPIALQQSMPPSHVVLQQTGKPANTIPRSDVLSSANNLASALIAGLTNPQPPSPSHMLPRQTPDALSVTCLRIVTPVSPLDTENSPPSNIRSIGAQNPQRQVNNSFTLGPSSQSLSRTQTAPPLSSSESVINPNTTTRVSFPSITPISCTALSTLIINNQPSSTPTSTQNNIPAPSIPISSNNLSSSQHSSTSPTTTTTIKEPHSLKPPAAQFLWQPPENDHEEVQWYSKSFASSKVQQRLLPLAAETNEGYV
eukprot:CAMPEP_0184654134 /NCGR_PEP_ID=MMETSP0308-20130426/11840_1 /TAXON_ID=38269 /ORGANISM="Gloeochaete witrockiana, Strain SAG 46.84" /LENGTH=658 /DNA_ID=CAMNT_0027089983 /DNA_START=141 /DNA_END=2117 /DNA_ORIENTATION=-